MRRAGMWLLRQIGQAARILFIAMLTVSLGAGVVWAANYALTQGAGTTFGSIVVGGVNYAQQLLCDVTTPSQCAAVTAAGQVKIEGQGATAAALSGNPVRIGLSDATNNQNWLTGSALGNNVTGNNMGAVAQWVYNVASAAWDRAPGDNATGTYTNLKGCDPSICNTNGQALMANSAPVALASNQTVADPCTFRKKTYVPINLTSSAKIITGTTALQTYICSFHLVTATAQNIALVEGTGTVCATNIFGLAGGTTAATGWNLAANSGLARGSGSATIMHGTTDANVVAADVCLLLSGSGQTSGVMSYVQE